MRLAFALAAAMAGLALAACGAGSPAAISTPLPTANLTVQDPTDDQGLFFMAPDQTLLLMLGNASSRDSVVLAVAGRYPNAILFRAVAVGRTTVTGFDSTHCSPECNARAPLKITVAVVSAAELQQGVAISEQDQSWVVHFKSGQPFVVTLKNLPGGPAWAKLTSANPAIVVPDQAAMASADGIQGRFRAGAPGRAGVYASGPDCPSGSACPPGPYLGFTILVFA